MDEPGLAGVPGAAASQEPHAGKHHLVAVATQMQTLVRQAMGLAGISHPHPRPAGDSPGEGDAPSFCK